MRHPDRKRNAAGIHLGDGMKRARSRDGNRRACDCITTIPRDAQKACEGRMCSDGYAVSRSREVPAQIPVFNRLFTLTRKNCAPEGTQRHCHHHPLTRAGFPRRPPAAASLCPALDTGMTSGFPWQVKGVRQRTRETAREAARRSGMSVGAWLDGVITDSAVDAGLEPPRPPYRDDEIDWRAPLENSPGNPDND